jgi:tripartite-type tricarboxylate transporter receptor subunit TctC
MLIPRHEVAMLMPRRKDYGRDLMRIVMFAVSFALCYAHSTPGGAQGYPVKPLRLVSPYAPGGGTDILARLIGQKLSDALGQSVIVENRPGAGGVIGTEIVARSAPDGYTIMLASPSPIVVAPHLYKKLPYDPLKDLAPITMIAVVPALLVVHPSLPVKSVKDVVALARSRPGQLTFSSSGNGGTGHLAGEMLKMMTGVDMVHVPYKGTGPATTAVLSGEVSMSFGNIISTLPYAKSGRLRAIAVTTLKRSRVLPDIPAIAETFPGYSAGPWYGVLAPAGMPAPILSRLNGEIVKILRSPEITQNLSAEGADPVGNTPAEFAAHLQAETERWGKVVRQTKMKAE